MVDLALGVVLGAVIAGVLFLLRPDRRAEQNRQLLQSTAQLTARTKVAEERADDLLEKLGAVLETITQERSRSSEVSYLRSRVQALEETITESAAVANARVAARIDRSSYAFVEEGQRRERVTEPKEIPDGVQATPPADLMDPVTMGQEMRVVLREGETRVVSPDGPAEVPPPPADETYGQSLISIFENWPSEAVPRRT